MVDDTQGDYFGPLHFEKRPNGSIWTSSLGDPEQDVVDTWCTIRFCTRARLAYRAGTNRAATLRAGIRLHKLATALFNLLTLPSPSTNRSSRILGLTL
jgi:hypothetical protein